MEPAAGRCGLAGDVTRPPCDPSDRTETGHEGDDGGRTVECAPTRAGRLPRRPFPAAALARLHAFRASLHATFTRRADALLDLADALLSAPGPVWSLPQLSLQPAHRRGWGSTYAALARGRIDPERLRDLLVSSLPVADPLVFAVDVTTWPRCDAECSPARGYYYHPSRHSAGQPIIAGWAYQWVCQLGFERDSWTAPVDARRLDPLDDTDRTAAAQVRALLARLPAGGPVPLVAFDAGYDSAQLSLDLADLPVAVLVRLRSDRCFYADPPPRPPGATGRPRRHGAKLAFADPTTWPAPTATLVASDEQYGTVTVQAWAGLHPKQQRHPGRGSGGPRPIVRGTILRVAVERVPARTRPPKVGWLWWAGPPGCTLDLDLAWRGYARRFDLEHTIRFAKQTLGWATPRPPAAPGPRRRCRSAAAVGAAPTTAAPVTGPGPPRVPAAPRSARHPGECAETRRALPRPPQGQPPRARHAPPSHQEARQETPQEAKQGRQGRLSAAIGTTRPPTSSTAGPGMPARRVKTQAKSTLQGRAVRGHEGLGKAVPLPYQ